MEKNEIKYADVPREWALCWQYDCPLADRCLRRMAAATVPEGKRQHLCVLPTCRQGDDCPMYAQPEPTTVAWGMTELFQDVPWRSRRPMRQALMALFGDERRYYRFRSGRWPMSPRMQEAIAQVMAKFGYTGKPHFDRMGQILFFDDTTDYFFAPE